MKPSNFIFGLSYLLISCAASAQTIPIPTSLVNNGKVWAAAYQQRAAEYKALCFQAYNIAKLRLDEAMRIGRYGKPLAVITDVDETVLDNSPESARAALANENFEPAKWKAWTARAVCDTVPGAPDFFKYAASQGVTVFYVTNRDDDERPQTLKNLRMYNLPNVDEKHLLTRSGGISSKEVRRQNILKDYAVLLLFGDNLPDFDSVYDNHPLEGARTKATQDLREKWGKRYIVLPNPAYGDWEGAFGDFKKRTQAQTDSVIKAKVRLQ